jgi:hypothetical protein
MIIYKGKSVLDGSPIVAIATGMDGTANPKTGEMVQVWILCDNGIAPHHAAKLGQDSSVCGSCSHRHYLGGDCYVTLFQAPLAVWTKYMAGGYDDYQRGDLEGRQVRFGAYGDPAAVPYDSWEPVLEECDLDGSTGYSHQLFHKNYDPRIGLFCQISADTPKQALKIQSMGLKTFRVAGNAELALPGEIECLSESEGMTCAECKLCNGQQQNIVITAHGAKSKSVKQHDIIARAA